MSHQGKSHKLVTDALYVQEILASTTNTKNTKNTKSQTDSSKAKPKNPQVDQIKQLAADASKLYTDDEIDKLLDENDRDISVVVNHILDAAPGRRDVWTSVNRGKKNKESGQKADDFQSVQSRGSGKRGRGDHPNRDLRNEDGSNASSSPQRFNRNSNQRHQNGERRQPYSRDHDNKRTNGSRPETPETTTSSEKQDQTHKSLHQNNQRNPRFHYRNRDTQTNDAAATKSDATSVEAPADLKEEPQTSAADVTVVTETKEQRENEKKEAVKANAVPVSRPVTKVFSYREAVTKGIKPLESEKVAPAPVAPAAKKASAKDRKKTNKDTKPAQQDKSESTTKSTTETAPSHKASEAPAAESVAQSNLSDKRPQQQPQDIEEPAPVVESAHTQSASHDSVDLIQNTHQNFSQKKYSQTKNVILPQGIQEDSDICFGDFDNQGSSNNGPLDYQEVPQDKSGQYMNADHLEMNGGIQGMFPFVPPSAFVPHDQDGLQDFMRNRHNMDSSAAVATPFIPMHMPFVPPFMHFMAQQMAVQQHHQHLQQQQNQSPPASSSSSASPSAQSQSQQYFDGQFGSRGNNNNNNTSNGGSPPTSGSSGSHQPSGASSLPTAGAPGSVPFPPPPYAQFFPSPYTYGSQQPFYAQPPQMGTQYAPPPQMYGGARFPILNGPPQAPYNHFMSVQPSDDGGSFSVMGSYPPYMGAVDGGMGYNIPQGVVTPPGSTGNNSNNGASSITQSPVISGASKQMPHAYSSPYTPVMKSYPSQDKNQMYSGERNHANSNGQRNNEAVGGQNLFSQFTYGQRGFGN